MSTDWESRCKQLQEDYFDTGNKKSLDKLYLALHDYTRAIIVKRERGVDEDKLAEICSGLATELVMSILKGKKFWVWGAYIAKRYRSYLYKKTTTYATEDEALDHHALVQLNRGDRVDNNPEHQLQETMLQEMLDEMVDAVRQTIDQSGRLLPVLDREVCRIYVLQLLVRWLSGASRQDLHSLIRASQLPHKEWIRFLLNEAMFRIRMILKEGLER